MGGVGPTLHASGSRIDLQQDDLVNPNPKSSSLNPKLNTLNPKSYTLHPKPYPKSQTLNSKAYRTLQNPKPSLRKPHPSEPL